MSSVVMAGSLGEFDVPAVLQAVSLSRQYTLIRLWDEDSQLSGEIRIKAGQVVEAACEADRGKLAFSSILGRPHSTFRVERMSDPVTYPEPVGSLSSLLLSAASAPAPKPAPKRTVVPLRQNTAAPPRKTAAPPPRSTLAPPTGRSPAPPALRTKVRIDDAPAELGQTMAAAPAIDGVIVMMRNDASRAWSWQRSHPNVPPEALAGFAFAMSNAAQGSLTAAIVPGDMATTTIELGRARIVIEQPTSDLLVAYTFGANVPLGVVRHCVAQARRAVGALFGQGAPGQQAAI